MVKSLTSVISFYVSLIQCSCKQLLTYNRLHEFPLSVLQKTPCGALFQEFVVYLTILQNYAPIVTSNCDSFAQFADLLDLYDQFNKKIDSIHNYASSDEQEDLGWSKQEGRV